jgi:hypothetical protein
MLSHWSNCRGSDFYRGSILLAIFVFCLGTSVGRANPFLSGELIWQAKERAFSGRFTYALPESASPQTGIKPFDEFWLLPNRDLEMKEPDSQLPRELREFHAARTEDEWPFPESRYGAIVIVKVLTGLLSGTCPDSEEKLARVITDEKLSAAPFQFVDDERVLRVPKRPHAGSPAQKSANLPNCRLVRINFQFHPRLANGNFAVRADGSGVFSGPVYPLWRDLPVRTVMTVKSSVTGISAKCASCIPAKNSGGVYVEFLGLPPPLYIQKDGNSELMTLANLTPSESKVQDSGLFGTDDLQETLKDFRNNFPAAAAALPKWHLQLTRGLPIERLVLEQKDEIQIHDTFGKVNPVLGRFHKAALYRALGRSYVRHVLRQSSTGSNWSALRHDEMTARVLAEIWVRDYFPNLFSLRNISEKFSFVPFFRAVLQGNAFVNNSVFVGVEESSGRLDYSLTDDFFAPLKGDELLARIDSCLDNSARAELRTAAAEVQNSRRTVREFQSFAESMNPKNDCRAKMARGIIPAWVPEEKIEIQESHKKGILVLQREIVRSNSTANFLFGQDPKAGEQKDALRVEVKTNSGVSKTVSIPPDEKDFSASELPAGTDSAAVLPPHRAVSGERLKFPRPLRTVLQAFALNYDSRRSDFTFRSQFQTSQAGDDWGKTLTLGLRREYSSNFFDMQMSSRIPSLVRAANTSIALSSSTKLVKAPPAFLGVSYSVDSMSGSTLYPEGLALSIILRRPLTLSAFKELSPDPRQEWLLTTAVPLAERLTWIENLTYARSDSDVDAGLRSVPGWPSETFKSKEYVVLRSEIRNTVTQNMNTSIAQSVLFQHAVFYAAHVLAVDDLEAARLGELDTRSAQSVVAGVRFLGAFFGAKDQSLGFEVARVLSRPVFTSIGFFVGKSLN